MAICKKCIHNEVCKYGENRSNGLYCTGEKCKQFKSREDCGEVAHGRWLYDSGSGRYFCSACDEYALSFKKDTLYGGDLYEVCLTDYCPHCGAKMDA